MEITVQKLGQEELKKKGVFGWPVWTKEVSRFDWQYDPVEECYSPIGTISAGKGCTLRAADGSVMRIKETGYDHFA